MGEDRGPGNPTDSISSGGGISGGRAVWKSGPGKADEKAARARAITASPCVTRADRYAVVLPTRSFLTAIDSFPSCGAAG